MDLRLLSYCGFSDVRSMISGTISGITHGIKWLKKVSTEELNSTVGLIYSIYSNHLFLAPFPVHLKLANIWYWVVWYFTQNCVTSCCKLYFCFRESARTQNLSVSWKYQDWIILFDQFQRKIVRFSLGLLNETPSRGPENLGQFSEAL